MMEVPQLHGFGPAANCLLEAYKMLLKFLWTLRNIRDSHAAESAGSSKLTKDKPSSITKIITECESVLTYLNRDLSILSASVARERDSVNLELRLDLSSLGFKFRAENGDPNYSVQSPLELKTNLSLLTIWLQRRAGPGIIRDGLGAYGERILCKAMFSPKALSLQFTKGLLGWFLQVLLLKVSLYSLGSGEAPLLDIVAYAGYAFTG
ncbi:hypothetical protein IFM89_039127 [Coptis chinensis]|uniref:Uncharacterized protein n=1 Tax=Coptis chinensis TaxID=261450 RepID=A0A835ILN2_9MAGN|nr:hypothetical protein IFM89_039127 [Coptis chinensis]